MAKINNKQAAVYAKPHTMSGGSVNPKDAISVKKDPNSLAANEMKPGKPTYRVSAGDPDVENVKTSGIKIRGTGAATKGVMARGPMG